MRRFGWIHWHQTGARRHSAAGWDSDRLCRVLGPGRLAPWNNGHFFFFRPCPIKGSASNLFNNLAVGYVTYFTVLD